VIGHGFAPYAIVVKSISILVGWIGFDVVDESCVSWSFLVNEFFGFAEVSWAKVFLIEFAIDGIGRVEMRVVWAFGASSRAPANSADFVGVHGWGRFVRKGRSCSDFSTRGMSLTLRGLTDSTALLFLGYGFGLAD
jgi:hypothetical protein